MSVKSLFVAALLASCVLATGERDYEAMFREFKATHLKAYASVGEESSSFKNFVSNMKQAETLQASNPLATFGVNAFADMSEEEFSRRFLDAAYYTRVSNEQYEEVEAPLADRIAARGAAIDWRAKGAVTPVKNQGSCGSCWAFSATGNIEGQWFLQHDELAPLSEQELVSCDKTDAGCNGGLMDNAFNWLIRNRKGQIVTQDAYPYVSGGGSNPTCRTGELDKMAVGATIVGYNHLAKSEDTLAAFVLKTGPIAIALDASSFQSYKSGIVTNCVSSRMNHGVLAVGFDDNNVPPYWIIKNSWGTSWGEAGYIRVAKGSNQCLLNSYSTTAIVQK